MICHIKYSLDDIINKKRHQSTAIVLLKDGGAGETKVSLQRRGAWGEPWVPLQREGS